MTTRRLWLPALLVLYALWLLVACNDDDGDLVPVFHAQQQEVIQ